MPTIDWFEKILEILPEHPVDTVWTSGGEILCSSEEIADILADMLEQLYASQGEEVIVNTGSYNREEDARNNTIDEFTGWWYVDIV